MAAMTREDILKAGGQPKVQQVEVPEWGGTVCIRVMSVGERDQYENDWVRSKTTGLTNFRTKFLVRCLCDESGRPLFGERDVQALAEKDASVMSRLWDIAMSANALKSGDVEELAKN